MVTVTTTYQNDEAEPVRQGWLVVPFGLNSLMQWGTRPLPPHRGLATGQILYCKFKTNGFKNNASHN